MKKEINTKRILAGILYYSVVISVVFYIIFKTNFLLADEKITCPSAIFCGNGECFSSTGDGNTLYFKQTKSNDPEGSYAFYGAYVNGNTASCIYTDATAKTGNEIILKSTIPLYAHQNQYWYPAGSGIYNCYSHAYNCTFTKK
jgi:hypothetical protein